MWYSQKVPTQWKQANILALFKHKPNSSKHDPAAYRPIALTSVLARMFERMVKPVLMDLVLPHISVFQHGFVPNKSTYDAIAVLLNGVHGVMRPQVQASTAQ